MNVCESLVSEARVRKLQLREVSQLADLSKSRAASFRVDGFLVREANSGGFPVSRAD